MRDHKYAFSRAWEVLYNDSSVTERAGYDKLVGLWDVLSRDLVDHASYKSKAINS